MTEINFPGDITGEKIKVIEQAELLLLLLICVVCTIKISPLKLKERTCSNQENTVVLDQCKLN